MGTKSQIESQVEGYVKEECPKLVKIDVRSSLSVGKLFRRVQTTPEEIRGRKERKEREKERQRKREKERKREREKERKREREKERKRERQKDRKIERQKDRKIERQKDRKIERQKDRKYLLFEPYHIT